jgi:hypothetical protein
MNKIQTEVIYPNNFGHKPVTGAYCGPTGPDTFVLELFVERTRHAGMEVRANITPSTPQGTIETPFVPINERLIVGGFVLSLEGAKMLRGLLDQQIGQLEAIKNRQSGQISVVDEKNKMVTSNNHGGYL